VAAWPSVGHVDFAPESLQFQLAKSVEYSVVIAHIAFSKQGAALAFSAPASEALAKAATSSAKQKAMALDDFTAPLFLLGLLYSLNRSIELILPEYSENQRVFE